ncbi:MAG: LLM class F420-dependent oxidoreductase [Candidatus Limnocylindrales bacterium]|jgi:probable F420-dependent oxidoreductase
MTLALGHIGIWSGQLRRGDRARSQAAVIELESLGYGTVWMPGGSGPEFFAIAEGLLATTRRIALACGILSVWTEPAAEVSSARASLTARFPGRFLLGLGVSHPQVVERTGRRFEHPVAVMAQYLDQLALTPMAGRSDEFVLAALGPRMLALARDCSWGAHPYLVTPDHTRLARFVLGPGRLLAPEQAVVLETNPARARAIARRHVESYLRMPNYANNLMRLGFSELDLAGGGSDRLVDALVAWGDLADIQLRIEQHFAAGADHVCLQVLGADAESLPLAEWRALAALLES